jgi:hypothetical protein
MERDSIIKQIELETEQKILNAYNTGELQTPIITDDSKTILPFNNPEKQIDVLKNIMGEGVKNFETQKKRRMTYGEMREMFG